MFSLNSGITDAEEGGAVAFSRNRFSPTPRWPPMRKRRAIALPVAAAAFCSSVVACIESKAFARVCTPRRRANQRNQVGRRYLLRDKRSCFSRNEMCKLAGVPHCNQLSGI